MTRIYAPMRRMLASGIGQNIIANYLTVIWMSGLSLAFIPLYLKYLGPEQWGLVAICMAIQSFLGLLDAGLGQIMPRDIARVAGNKFAEARVFRVFSRAYIGLGIIGFVVGQISVPWLVTHWFNQGQGVSAETDLALRLVLVQFLFQFANNAHTGYWNGRQTQKLANLRQCAFGTAKHAGALCLVFFWRADIFGYLLPFALVSVFECWANRRTVHRELGELTNGGASLEDFRVLARETGVLVIGVVIGMLASQADRIILSRLVDVISFGHYVIVANLGLAFMQLQYPLIRAFFPRIARADADGTGSSSIWQLALGVSILCVLPCAVVVAMAPWLLQAWIGNPEIVEQGTIPLRLILSAVALNALYQLIYQRILASGHGRFVIIINTSLLIIVVPLLIILTPIIGIVAGGVSWLILALTQFIFGVVWLLSRQRLSMLPKK